MSKNNVQTEKAYCVGIHRYCFQAGKPGEILGVVSILVNGDPRVCLHVRFEDGQEDFVPYFLESQRWAIIAQSDLDAGRIPEVIY